MKKLNQKGFTHHLVMFVILAVVLGAMGFAGYRVWQNRNIDAQAASWKPVAVLSSGGQISGRFDFPSHKVTTAAHYRTCVAGVISPVWPMLVTLAQEGSSGVSRMVEDSRKAFCTGGKYYSKGELVSSYIVTDGGYPLYFKKVTLFVQKFSDKVNIKQR